MTLLHAKEDNGPYRPSRRVLSLLSFSTLLYRIMTSLRMIAVMQSITIIHHLDPPRFSTFGSFPANPRDAAYARNDPNGGETSESSKNQQEHFEKKSWILYEPFPCGVRSGGRSKNQWRSPCLKNFQISCVPESTRCSIASSMPQPAPRLRRPPSISAPGNTSWSFPWSLFSLSILN